MRNNQPVTQRAFTFPPDQTLVSVTDTKGRISYCNRAFIAVSGFTRVELLGQSHNIVRHPDMPEEAFRDMWATIQAGLPWSGMVKNRRKDGDHYWVMANATPMMDGDRITGFLSVRSLPDAQSIARAERLYGRMRADAAGQRRTLMLRQGRVMRCDLGGRLLHLLTPSWRGQLFGVQLLGAAAMLALGRTALPVWLQAGAALLLAASATAVLWRMAVAPLRAVVRDANQLASGDLSHPVGSGATGLVGELQGALIQLTLNLRTVVRDVRDEVDSLRVGAGEIAAGNVDLSTRTEAQAGSLEQTTASMAQISQMVSQGSGAARQAAELAQKTGAVAQRSNEAVDAVAQAMGEISDSSTRIGEITHLIEAVAFQINILALNAAVEAARAGDAGRGFAVVATEVRSLAQRTTAAALQIKQLVADSTVHVHGGDERTGEARARMREAVQSVARVAAVLDEISSAAGAQQASMARISREVGQMDAMTQQNAAMVEQLAAAAESLHEQVDSVNDSVLIFRLRKGEATVAQRDAVALRRQGKTLLAGGR